MTVPILKLIISVSTMLCYIIAGFILRKLKITDGSFAKAMSLLILYLAQIMMFLDSFITAYDKRLLINIIITAVASAVMHGIFFFIAKLLFRKAPAQIKKLLIYGTMFGNAGYMGIPICKDVLGTEFVLYSTVFIAIFNVYSFTVGRYIYTEDKAYLSVKKVFLNPAVIPIIFGMVLFFTGIGGWMAELTATDASGALINSGVLPSLLSVVRGVIKTLSNTVAPASMLLVGTRLAEIKTQGLLKDKYMYAYIGARLFLCPFVTWLIMKPLMLAGLLDTQVATMLLILGATPAAAATSMFAELYGGDKAYAGKLVAVSSVLSVVTIPVICLLMYL